jgi:Zn-dependent protease with chaperone function
MPFLLLLMLTVSCLPVNWPRPPEWVAACGRAVLGCFGWTATDDGARAGSVLLTWAGVALAIALAAAIAQQTRRALVRCPERRDTIARRHSSWRFYHLLSLFAVYGLSLYVLGWGWVVQGGAGEGVGEPLPGAELLVLVPFVTALLLSWTVSYDGERALHDAAGRGHTGPYWSRRAYLGFHVRQNLALVFVPLVLLMVVNDLPRLLPHEDDFSQRVAGGLVVITVVLTLVCMPWVLRLALGLRSLPSGPLRDRLLIASRRLRFRCSDLLLWNTRGGVANAMVVGLLPWLRYVVFTDRLLAEMTPDEVEAVFGHEVGHVKHRHMLYYLGFLLVSLAVMTRLWEAAGLESLLDLSTRKDLAVLPLTAMLGAYIFLVFGFLSRRCERQADIYGCRAVSCARMDCCGHEDGVLLQPGGRALCPTGIRTFIDALEKVASLNGISRERPGWLQSWQHSTIARRVDFLQRVLTDPLLERHFQRRVGLVKWALLLGLATLLATIGTIWGWGGLVSF